MLGRVSPLIVLCLLAHGCTEPSPADRTGESRPAVGSRAEPTPNLATLGQEARAAKETEDWETARQVYLQALEVAPGHPIVYERIAEVEVRLGLLDEAAGHLATMAGLGGTTPQIDEPLFEPLQGRTGFAETAERIRVNGAPHEPSEILVTFDDTRLSPEGIARDRQTGHLFVGSFLQNKIVRITPEGTVSDLGTSASDGLGGVLGMTVDAERRALWAVSGSTSMQEMNHPAELVRYHVDTGALLGRYAAPKTDAIVLVNDVTVTPDGTAWVTESLGSALYRLPPGGEELELFLDLPGLGFANGIVASGDGRTLYVGHAEGLSAIDPETRAIERVMPRGDFTLVSADGLSWADGGLILVQNQPSLNNRVVQVELDATGRQALGLRVIGVGLPPGLDPYTSAVGDGFVYVTASPPIDVNADLGDAPPPAIARLPL